MKLKNTLGVVIGSLVAASAMNAFAQGQNSVEIEAFGKRYFTDSVRNMKNADLYGGSIGYFLTDDVELALSYGEYHDVRGTYETGNKKVHGNLTSLDAIYHSSWRCPTVSTMTFVAPTKPATRRSTAT